jgi:integrase
LRAEHIILYRKYLEEGRLTGEPLQKTTVNRKLAVVKSFLNWLRVNHHLSENPAQWVKGFPQSQESTLLGLTDSETRQMLDAPRTSSRSGSLHGAILYVLFYLGLRKGELLALRMGDISEDRGVKILRVMGKGNRVRVLPIPNAVLAALSLYFERNGRDPSDAEAPLFMPTKNPRTKRLRKALNPNAITYIVIRYARKTGVLKRISPHSCRATCISHALDKRATHRSVQHLAGWSTPLMIQRYDKRREDLKNSAAYLIDYQSATASA